MQAGKLKRRIILQQLVAGQDTIGQPVQTWSALATVWASILLKNGAQTIRADADVSIIQASIRIRRRTDVTAGMRVLDGANVYDIKAVLPDEASRAHVDLVCERVA
ncbi:MAG: phage head closure protein [Proteobacteria bacterium]|nr:phage head closure protein [Pseudomonadota bacterium]